MIASVVVAANTWSKKLRLFALTRMSDSKKREQILHTNWQVQFCPMDIQMEEMSNHFLFVQKQDIGNDSKNLPQISKSLLLSVILSEQLMKSLLEQHGHFCLLHCFCVSNVALFSIKHEVWFALWGMSIFLFRQHLLTSHSVNVCKHQQGKVRALHSIFCVSSKRDMNSSSMTNKRLNWSNLGLWRNQPCNDKTCHLHTQWSINQLWTQFVFDSLNPFCWLTMTKIGNLENIVVTKIDCQREHWPCAMNTRGQLEPLRTDQKATAADLSASASCHLAQWPNNCHRITHAANSKFWALSNWTPPRCGAPNIVRCLTDTQTHFGRHIGTHSKAHLCLAVT